MAFSTLLLNYEATIIVDSALLVSKYLYGLLLFALSFLYSLPTKIYSGPALSSLFVGEPDAVLPQVAFNDKWRNV
jgi:hypothetical protein